ncbi:MAG: DUF4058 domain-containing protein [Gemmataceae bacterium]
MPLLDHFRPPVDEQVSWSSFHANWATRLADQITERLPVGFTVEELSHPSGGVEIDVATYQDDGTEDPLRSDWQPPPADQTADVVFPEQHEVKVYRTTGGRTLVAAVELVSPGNKDRATERRAFAAKCAGYLYAGVGLIVVDVVTERTANLHNEIVRVMDGGPGLLLPEPGGLYAVAYRPVVRDGGSTVDQWVRPLAVGGPLPELPLRLAGDYFVPVDFEAAYQEACRRRRIA